jgi:hypothetical protein
MMTSIIVIILSSLLTLLAGIAAATGLFSRSSGNSYPGLCGCGANAHIDRPSGSLNYLE